MKDIIWKNDQNFTVNDVEFTLMFGEKPITEGFSTNNHFMIMKSKVFIEQYYELIKNNQPEKIIEIGVYKGGSFVFFDQVCSPQKIVAIDRNSKPLLPLNDYIKQHNRMHHARVYYKTNQANQRAMKAILENEFPDQDVELVIDDASHRYQETKASFNFIFPYLKKGGHYIIEDWGWAHWEGVWQEKPHKLTWCWWRRPPFGRRALTNFLVELCMLAASRRDIIESIYVDGSMIIVKKGSAKLPTEFDVSSHYLTRGKKFKPYL